MMTVRSGRQRIWTEADLKWLLKNRDRGWVWCARKLGVTPTCLRSQVARWGIGFTYTRLTDGKRVCELYSAGKTLQEIGDEMGVTDETVRCLLKRLNVPRRTYDERWRSSSIRKDNARVLHETKRRQLQIRASELGWPHFKYHEALVLAALERLPRTDRNAVALEIVRICQDRGWRICLSKPLTVLNVLVKLSANGFVVDYGKGNTRRVYRIRRKLKDMSLRQLRSLAKRSTEVRRELSELTRMKCRLVKEARRVRSRKAAS